MGALAGIVAFLIFLNGAFPYVNALGVANVTFANSPNVNITAIQQVGGCSNNGAQCGVNLGGAGAISTLITFGDFLWAAANFLIQIPISIGLPYIDLTQNFYAPVLTATAYNIVFWVIFAFWINDYVAGRYHMAIP